MKIAMIGQKGIPAIYGGIERHVEELAARLSEGGFDVTVFCRPWYGNKSEVKGEKLKIYKGINLVYLPSLKTKHLDAISHTFLATIYAMFGKYDIIHYHGVGPSLLSWMPRIFCRKIKVVTTFHCIDRKHQKWGFFSRLMLRMGEWAACKFAHETITVSKTLQQYCSEAYDKDTAYVPNGVNVNAGENYPSSPSEILEKYNLEKDKYLLMVSRLVRHKGAHYLIKAFQDIRKNDASFSGLKLVFAGDSVFTDDYVKELKDLAKDDQSVVFVGFQSGRPLEDLFLNSLAVVHPSESEGLPVAVLEAMSYGKVVLASDIPENMELIKDYGFSFQNKNVSDLTLRLREVLVRHDLLEKGAEARKFVMENYNWEYVVSEVKKVYLGAK
ncbi:glycosyltransferase family 4 protein [Patescibacteria group bacterium]|nr:glycosyltransferase family 4 protein [Patescibacteria group bacterium]